MSKGSSIKAPLKHVQLFLEINIRPNSAVIGAATRESRRGEKKGAALTAASVSARAHTV